MDQETKYRIENIEDKIITLKKRIDYIETLTVRLIKIMNDYVDNMVKLCNKQNGINNISTQ